MHTIIVYTSVCFYTVPQICPERKSHFSSCAYSTLTPPLQCHWCHHRLESVMPCVHIYAYVCACMLSDFNVIGAIMC